jgi:uracil phosphoribosyltransferase
VPDCLTYGLLNYFDQAENGFISAYRQHPNNDDYFDIIVEYQAIADFNGSTYFLLILCLPLGSQ